MRQHHAFRFAGRARGVDDCRQVIRLRIRYTLIANPSFAQIKLASFFFELGQRQSFRIWYSFRLEENDVLYLRTFPKRSLQFIKLLSIREKENAGARVVQYVTDLRGR